MAEELYWPKDREEQKVYIERFFKSHSCGCAGKQHRGSSDAGVYESGIHAENVRNRLHLVLQPFPAGTME